MSSSQLSLLSGDLLSQHRFTLQALLDEDLDAVRQYAEGSAGDYPGRLDHLLLMIRQTADELRAIGCPTEQVPF